MKQSEFVFSDVLCYCVLQEEVKVGGGSTYGVCFVETSIGKFHVSMHLLTAF